MNAYHEHLQNVTRRHFLREGMTGLGAVALSTLMGKYASAGTPSQPVLGPLAPKQPFHNAKAKNVIYFHMAGSPPQQELFDYKPKLQELNNKDCPDEFLKGERFAFIKGHPKLLGTPYKFSEQGESGLHMSELLPHLGGVADDLCVIRSMHTDQFNHAPAQMMLYTGFPQFGKPSMGSWITYGLGSENQDLPGFVVLVSGDKVPSAGKSVWGSGFLPSVYQGVQCRTTGEPVLYVTDPKGMNRKGRRRSLDALRDLNKMQFAEGGDPETLTRIEQYELAFRMQMSVPNAMDISKETAKTHEMYGSDPNKPSFANNCVLARRMVESGVRFVQLFDWGWDVHGTGKTTDLMTQLPKKCKEVDQPIAALINDLKQRGMLDDTLIVWSGEFGRTPMNEKRDNSKFLGRDHHPHSMSLWMAGGGIKGGMTYGETDELGYHATEDKAFVSDLQATMLHLLGLDPYKFNVPYQGLKQRLIGPSNDPKILHKILA